MVSRGEAARPSRLSRVAHARGEHDGGEGLGDVIVRAALQTAHLVGVLGACGQQHDRQVLFAVFLLAYLAQHLEAVHARHHDVENGEVERGAAVFDQLERCFAVGRLEDGVSVALEKVADEPADARLVVCDEYSRHKNSAFAIVCCIDYTISICSLCEH